MENICKDCKHCYRHSHQEDPEPFKTKSAAGLELAWHPINGSRCGLLGYDMFDIQECERFEKKSEASSEEAQN